MGRTACTEPQCLYKGALYGMYGPGIESRWGARFYTPALGPTQPSVQCVPGFFSGGKERPGRDANPSPPSSAVVMKE